MHRDRRAREIATVSTALRRLASAEAREGGLPDPQRIWARARLLRELESERAVAQRAALPALAGQLAACAVLATALLAWLASHGAPLVAFFTTLTAR
jgi:hypothetical protein